MEGEHCSNLTETDSQTHSLPLGNGVGMVTSSQGPLTVLQCLFPFSGKKDARRNHNKASHVLCCEHLMGMKTRARVILGNSGKRF